MDAPQVDLAVRSLRQGSAHNDVVFRVYGDERMESAAVQRSDQQQQQ